MKVKRFISIVLLLSVALVPALATPVTADLAGPQVRALRALQAIASTITATTRYARVDGTGNGTGSWANASSDLRTLISASSSADEVWVGAGVYKPGASQTDSFYVASMNAGVKIYGGFPPTGNPAFTERAPTIHLTTLSGDIGNLGTTSDNCYVVVTIGSVSALSDTRLDGFTITGGNGGSGAGISMGSGSSPTIRNCRLIGNVTALNGGAVSVGAGLSSPVMEDCTFESNQAAGGAAIFFAATTSPALPQLTRCRFIGNFATGSAGGGAIVHNQNGFPGSFGNLRVQDCIFIANESHAGSGGAVALQFMSHSEFTQCIFSRNRAFRSGGGEQAP